MPEAPVLDQDTLRNPATFGVPGPDKDATLARYTPQELQTYRTRGMIGPSGIPTLPPGAAKINSQGLPANPTPLTPQERTNDKASYAAIKAHSQPAPPQIGQRAAPPAGGVSYNPEIIRAQTVQYWMGQGLKQHVAEGIADAIQPESGFNPAAWNANDNGGPSGGLYQDHGPRLEALQRFAQQHGKSWTDPMIQHAFANWERLGGDAVVAQHWPEIANAPDRPTAKALWQKYFERGVLQGGAGGSGGNAGGNISEMDRAAQAVRTTALEGAGKADVRARTLMGKVKNFEDSIPDTLNRIHEARQLSDEAMRKAIETTGKQPHPPEIDGMQKMGSLATIIGILGGMLTRAPMTASLNAAASAIEAAKAGDLEHYNLAFDSWKTNNDMLFKIADLQTKRANDIAGDEKMGLEERRSALDLYLRATGQAQLADELRIKGMDAWFDHEKTINSALEAKRTHDLQVMEYHQRVLDTQARDPAAMAHQEWRQNYLKEKGHYPSREEDSAAYKQAQKDYPKEKVPEKVIAYDPQNKDADGNPTPFVFDKTSNTSTTLDGSSYTPKSITIAGKGSQQATLTDQQKDNLAKDIALYRIAPFGSYAMRSPLAMDVMERVKKFNPNYAAPEYFARVAAGNTMGRRGATLMMASNAADQLIPIVRDLSNKVPRTKFSNVNDIIIAARNRTGDPDTVAFGQALNSLLYVYMRALNPSGIPRVADLQKGEHMLQTGWASGQLDAVLDQMYREIGAEKSALKMTVNELGGLFGTNADPNAAMADPMPYKNTEDVRKAVATGALPAEEGKLIIRSNFEKPPKGIPADAHWVGTSGGKDVWRTPSGENWSP